MATRHRFQVDGETHVVVVDDSGERITVAIDDADPIEVDVTGDAVPGLFSILDGSGRPTRAYVARDGRNLRVVVGGRSFVLGAPGSARGRGAAGSADPPGKISAPLAGVAVEVRVAVGDRIEARQGVFVIEAMKMQNEVQAPHSGVVTAIHVERGARVERGEILVEYTPDEA